MPQKPRTTPFPTKYRAFRDHYKQKVYETCAYFGLGEDIEKEWNIHALRHTKLTRLANAGANAIQIKEWAGHHSLEHVTGLHPQLRYRSGVPCVC